MLLQRRDLAPLAVLARLAIAGVLLCGALGAVAGGALYLHHQQTPSSLSLNARAAEGHRRRAAFNV